MPQTFAFKKFTITQTNSAMKVGTDSVLLGALCECDDATSSILDVGTGTGILALMLAQRTPHANITAIDINSETAQQAIRNVAASPYHNRINVIHSSLQNYAVECGTTFDLIISNPPYFDAGILPESEAATTARHTHDLNLHDLLRCSKQLLKAGGSLSLILPSDKEGDLRKESVEFLLNITQITYVYSHPSKEAIRIIATLKNEPIQSSLSTRKFYIRDNSSRYTQEYIETTKKFYITLKE